jgi:hypothetical protein
LEVQIIEMTKNQSFDDLPARWPPKEIVDKLVQKAAGSYIFASTVYKVINPQGDLDEQLEQVAMLVTDTDRCLGVDDLYWGICKSALQNMSDKDVVKCCSILRTIILLQSLHTMAG